MEFLLIGFAIIGSLVGIILIVHAIVRAFREFQDHERVTLWITSQSHAFTFFRRPRPARSYKSPTPLVSLALGRRLLTDPVQHHAKACGATYHARVRLWGLIQRHRFDHRADVLKDTELESVFLVDRGSGQTA